MQSTYSVFPANRKLLDEAKIPFAIYTQPMKQTSLILNKNEEVPRCDSCKSYFNGLCISNSYGWNCTICGKRCSFDKYTDTIKNVSIQPSFSIISDPIPDSAVIHVIIISCGSIEPAKIIMSSLPPDSVVHVYVITSSNASTKIVTKAGRVGDLGELPKESIRVGIEKVFQVILSLLLLPQRCIWVRAFCSGGDATSIMKKLNDINKIRLRIDFYVDTPISRYQKELSELLPGVLRFFGSFLEINNLISASDIASLDCISPYSYQCKIQLKSGSLYSSICGDKRSAVPVISSQHTSIPFSITPPQSNTNITFQAIQSISEMYTWNPPTNVIEKHTNISTFDFPISDSIDLIMQSVTPTAVFDYSKRFSISTNFQSSFPNIKSLESMNTMAQKSPQFNSFMYEFFSQCQPLTWKYVLGCFLEVWKDKETNELNVVIIKKYPNLYFYIKEGSEVLIGDAIKGFIENCKPLIVYVKQISFKDINSVLSGFGMAQLDLL